MSTYTPEELVALCAQQKIDLDQLAGYMLQNMVRMDKELKALKSSSPPPSQPPLSRPRRPKTIRPN